MKYSKLQIFCLLFILLSCLYSSCSKEIKNTIPSIYLDFTINVKTDPEYLNLDFQNNSMIIKNDAIGATGFNNNGVIVYNAGNYQFYAFDCTCPFDYPKKSVAVKLTGAATAKCPDCGSIYVLTSSGMPTLSGPATLPLKEYKAVFNPNTGELHVYN